MVGHWELICNDDTKRAYRLKVDGGYLYRMEGSEHITFGATTDKPKKKWYESSAETSGGYM